MPLNLCIQGAGFLPEGHLCQEPHNLTQGGPKKNLRKTTFLWLGFPTNTNPPLQASGVSPTALHQKQKLSKAH